MCGLRVLRLVQLYVCGLRVLGRVQLYVKLVCTWYDMIRTLYNLDMWDECHTGVMEYRQTKGDTNTGDSSE